MPLRTSVFIASSLDGFIARQDGDIAWLTALPAPPGEDFGYQAFFDSVDVLVVGRHTFETVLGFDAWPYEGKRVVVLSRTLTPEALPEAVRPLVELHFGPVPELLDALESSGARRVYVDGGQTIHSFLQAGLLDEMIVTRIPLLIGTGIPLFGDAGRDILLSHVETRTYINGFVQSYYRIDR